MIDFNISTEISDNIILNNKLQLVLQQIDLLFDTEVNDVLGDTSFGSNYDRYLYTVGISNYALESKILSDIKKLDLMGLNVDVSVSLVEGSIRDIAFIDIKISGDFEDYTKTYMIK